MITELTRVQTEAQKQSYIENGYEEYIYIACRKEDVCSQCSALNNKVFKVANMMPEENAPPMHPYCHCSTAAHMDDTSYQEWINRYKEHGLDFKSWKQLDSALSKMMNYEGDLIRTVDFSDYPDKDERIQQFMEEYLHTDKVTVNQYWSMSKEKGYNKDADIHIYVQDSKKGKDISSIGLDEKEVLYERKQEFYIIKTLVRNGKYFIFLKECSGQAFL